MFPGSFNGVLRKLHGCFMKVTKKIEGCFEGVLRVSQGSFMEEKVSRMFQGCFMIFKGVS